MARLATFDLDRRVFKHKRPLFVGVAPDAGRIAIDRIAQRFAHEAAVLVVTIRTLHAAFGHFVVEWLGERRFLISVALIAHAGFAAFQQKFRAFGRVR